MRNSRCKESTVRASTKEYNAHMLMKELQQRITELSKGCERCNGTGQELFEGSWIFCVCLDQRSTGIWNYLQGIIPQYVREMKYVRSTVA